MSAVNGWTMIVDGGQTESVIDRESKTIRFTLADAQNDTAFSNLLETATGTLGSVRGAIGTLQNGDRFTFSGGGDAGELVVTYKEGATAGEIRDLINRTGQAQASLASGISANDPVPYVPDAPTYVVGNTNNIKTDYRSGTTASEVVDLINNRLGHLFEATMLSGDSGTGTVSYMNASVVYGNVETESAVRFSGLDSGPVVRLVTGGVNRDLGVRLLIPSSEDIAAGGSTRILEIQLATDAAGNSITTAKDLADFFDTLSPSLTLGVNVELVYPDGIDPNGRVWGTDECGNTTVKEGCPGDFGRGVVRPTSIAGDCTIQQNDLVLLGNNQKILETGKPVARIAATVPGTPAMAHAANSDESVTIDFWNTSALNGVSLDFTSVASKAGFDSLTGRLSVYIDPTTLAKTDADFTVSAVVAVDSQIKQNWAAIRQFTHATGDPPEVVGVTYENDYTDLMNMIDSEAANDVLNISGAVSQPRVAETDKGPQTISVANGGFLSGEATFTLTGADMNEALNGITINMGAAGVWDPGTKTLTVKVDDVNSDHNAAAQNLQNWINAALTGIGITSGVIVTATATNPAFGVITADELQQLKFGKLDHGSSGGGTSEPHGGVGPNDAALIITSATEGTAMSGTNVYLVESDDLAVVRLPSSTTRTASS